MLLAATGLLSVANAAITIDNMASQVDSGDNASATFTYDFGGSGFDASGSDKLIVLGQVAKKYDLYTKITGGQRVDLFGARSEQLPIIWGELIEAGFESGHAYGKSMRTVKS